MILKRFDFEDLAKVKSTSEAFVVMGVEDARFTLIHPEAFDAVKRAIAYNSTEPQTAVNDWLSCGIKCSGDKYDKVDNYIGINRSVAYLITDDDELD